MMQELGAEFSAMLAGGRHRRGEAPLVRGIPFLGSAIPFGADAPEFLKKCRELHGEVFTILVANQRMTFVLDPHSHLTILQLQGDLSFGELAHEISARAFAHPQLSGEIAEKMEKTTAQHLKGESLSQLVEGTQNRLNQQFSRISVEETVGLYDFVRRMMFVVGAETMFGDGWADPEALSDFIKFDQQFPLLVAGVPAGLLGVAGSRKRLARRLGRGDGSALHRDRVAVQEGVIPPGLKGNTELSLLWAAVANTVPAAFWTVAFLAANPEALLAVSAEACAEDPKTPLLQSSILETLRLVSASITLRRAQRPTQFTVENGTTFSVRKGDLVCLFPYLMHHNPEIYEEPEQFRYRRFVGDGRGSSFFLRGKRLAMPLMPYGGGVSMCPGRHLANIQILQFVRELLRRFDLKPLGPLPPLDHRRAGLGVLPPTQDFLVNLSPRGSNAIHP